MVSIFQYARHGYRFTVHRMVLRHDLIYDLLLMNEMGLTVWFGHKLWTQAMWGQILELRRGMTLATDCSFRSLSFPFITWGSCKNLLTRVWGKDHEGDRRRGLGAAPGTEEVPIEVTRAHH